MEISAGAAASGFSSAAVLLQALNSIKKDSTPAGHCPFWSG